MIVSVSQLLKTCGPGINSYTPTHQVSTKKGQQEMRDYPAIARKITFTLFLSLSVVSAGLITTATVNAIVGAELSGVEALAGVPSTVFLIAAAGGAFAWGLIMERSGRRFGLTWGMVLGAAGSFVAGAAIVGQSFLVFLGGMALLGVSQAAMQLGRFAAAEVHPMESRGRAIANVVIGGTVGSILGPILVGPTGRLAESMGVRELVGPYGASLMLFIIASGIVFLLLRPEPSQIARELVSQSTQNVQTSQPARPISEILRQPAVSVAIVAMVFGQMVMVMVMVITTLYMKKQGHDLTDISLVISSHTLGMYAFSIISGRLADRFGRETVITVGAATMVIASMGARFSPEVVPMAVALFLLGLGWNFCYVGGSTLLADQLTIAEQSRMQGFNDLLIGAASAVGSLGSGFVFAAVGFRAMGLIGAIVALLPLVLTLWYQLNRRRVAGGVVSSP
jgi:MFS family permease